MSKKVRAGRAQAAMEYLMTYGWAILVIAIVVAALFALGVFGGGTQIKLTCNAQGGYLCATPVLYTNGTAVVALGVSAPTVVTATACGNTTGGAPADFIPIFPPINITTFMSENVSFQCPSPHTLGSSFTGALYVQYNSGGVSGLVDQVGTLTGKVNKVSGITSTSFTFTTQTTTVPTTSIPTTSFPTVTTVSTVSTAPTSASTVTTMPSTTATTTSSTSTSLTITTTSTSSSSTLSSSTSSLSTASTSTSSTSTSTTTSTTATIAYTTGSNVDQTSLTLPTAPSGGNQYVCGGGSGYGLNGGGGMSGSWTTVDTSTQYTSNGRPSGTTCSVTSSSGNGYLAIAGAGLGTTTSAKVIKTLSTSGSLSTTFTPITSDVPTVITVACGGNSYSSTSNYCGGCNSITVPAGCFQISAANYGSGLEGTVYIAMCNGLIAGTSYTVAANFASGCSAYNTANPHASMAVYQYG